MRARELSPRDAGWAARRRWCAASSPTTSTSSTPPAATSRSRTSTSCVSAYDPARRAATAGSAARPAGLFLAAQDPGALARVRGRARPASGSPGPGTSPPTGSCTSSAYNELDDVYDRKYLDIDQVRQEYPHIVQLFKSSPLPAGDRARRCRARSTTSATARSSCAARACSRTASARRSRASTRACSSPTRAPSASAWPRCIDAIAEVYASIFGPDPIEYRAERGLLDLHEEMGDHDPGGRGRRASAATSCRPSRAWRFSNNEFRWSPRIRREDGLLRLVPGLGTRAVDRLADDYPVLIAPGQPGLRVNVTPEEVVALLRRRRSTSSTSRRNALRDARRCASCCDEHRRTTIRCSRDDRLGRRPRPAAAAGRPASTSRATSLVFTFEGLVARHAVRRAACGRCSSVLQEALGTPVDIEFASRRAATSTCCSAGRRAARPRTRAGADPARSSARPAAVLGPPLRLQRPGPRPHARRLRRSRARTRRCSATAASCATSAARSGALNTLLPKRQFVLMGPGRWGSRGDIRLGRQRHATPTSTTPRC